MRIVNCDCVDGLIMARDAGIKYDCIFADPPDNIGLGYDEYKDNLPGIAYYAWLDSIIHHVLPLTPVFWLSYYWTHDIEIKYRVRNILKYRHPLYEAKTFIWRYTFGQHLDTDCGSGYRYLLRISRSDHVWATDSIRIESERQRLGDSRANPNGRVPDDVWDIPRVVGNSVERRAWHPTQHPIALMERIIGLSTFKKPAKECRVADLFGGTGSTLRAGLKFGVNVDHFELSSNYCNLLHKELPNVPLVRDLGPSQMRS